MGFQGEYKNDIVGIRNEIVFVNGVVSLGEGPQ